MTIDEIMQASPVIPVLTIHDAATAALLAGALLRGGIRVLEVTLRTPDALPAIRAIRKEVPGAIVGAGTVLNEKDLQESRDAGSMFIVSPGATPALFAAATKSGIPFLPGVATASDIMSALAHGYDCCKFFPAENIGGIAALRSLSAPFSQVRFCPTGGITLQSAKDYLALPNVRCVGGSWVAPPALIEQKGWSRIEALAAETTAALRTVIKR
jgi:2-dehydro-3-deoxyphosphogluconate aldolase / (4S)-4-hydroxy-2-oxoglutarate aldolase